jgi:hypothetical protein
LNAWWNARYPEGEQGDPGEFIGAALDAWAEGGARALYRQTFRQYFYQQDTLLSATPRFVNYINMWIPPDPSPQVYDLGDLYTYHQRRNVTDQPGQQHQLTHTRAGRFVFVNIIRTHHRLPPSGVFQMIHHRTPVRYPGVIPRQVGILAGAGLCGVIRYLGQDADEHYIAHCRRLSRWVEFNDTMVSVNALARARSFTTAVCGLLYETTP